ncbi:hypothetical protein KY290_018372 [Solanum tuberosum]|uniref:Uncharacterized protein n=1 Tax=Solanum tuberosum TaxID=4113 RepID=A0ABQ7VE12_SOLTU|nr:hypothetical protein KY284_017308 [Solanum tuberosum]KAH0703044.1 hypothetical protein KY285_017322 [Solanum tuberosum]KAH0762299.1 hypothetical protein KY290_018372 [Solanum tuberosum]
MGILGIFYIKRQLKNGIWEGGSQTSKVKYTIVPHEASQMQEEPSLVVVQEAKVNLEAET